MEQMKCPACGGNILFDEDKEILFCPYCGAKMPPRMDALDKILKHQRHTQQFNEEVRQRRVKEKTEAAKKNTRMNMFLLFLAIIIIGGSFFFGIRGENNSEKELNALVTEIQADLEAGNYDIALFKTERLFWPHGDTNGQRRWNKQRESLEKVIKEARENAEKKK